MLRFSILSGITLSIVGLVFYLVVLRAQPVASTPAGPAMVVTPAKLASTQTSGGVGPGERPWMENYENGKLTSKFNAADFSPNADGSFNVNHPIAIFYLDKGQYVKVIGETGHVNCDSTAAPGSSKGLISGPTSSPKNGWLNHVHVELYSSETAAKPTEWMDTDNIHFDNEPPLPRMFTDKTTDAAGNVIAPDQVPVTVRGDDYEFDGKGLTVTWDAQQHLQMLRVDYGQRLEIKNPSKLSLPGMTPASPTATGGGVSLSLITGSGSPGLSASNPPERGLRPRLLSDARKPNVTSVAMVQKSSPPKPAQPSLPYRAVFHDQVKIDEGDRRMAIADVMTADFLQGSGQKKTAATPGVSPAVSPVAPPASAAGAPVVPSPVTQPVVNDAAKSPTTKPTKGPITIYWDGQLLVTPLHGQPMMSLTPGQSIVRLVGVPVKLTPEGSEVTAASATYRSPDGAVQLEHSDQIPLVRLNQTKGMNLSTGSIDYDPATEIAILTGPSELQETVNKKTMNAAWSQTGKLHVVRLPGQPNGVDHVDLLGDVTVTHPEFTLNSNELKLDLDLVPKTGGSSTEADEQLRKLTAIDNVVCRLIHPGKPTQGIDGDQLVIQTERTDDKKVIPREVIADGHVHAFDPDQSIVAGHLDALLVAKAGPATQAAPASPDDVGAAVDLDSLFANADVHAKLKNGATADAQELRVTTINGRQHVDLRGPDGAMVKDGKGSWLTGPIVEMDPATSGVKVTGAGAMEKARGSTTQPAKPIDVTWADSMVMDGTANTADVLGHVTVKNIDASGGTSTITGDKAHIDLVDTPKNSQTEKRKNDPKNQADVPGDMGGKQVKMLTLSGNVVGYSELDDAAGSPLRRGNLYGEKLIYTAANNTAIIPGPGKLFVENHKPDTTEASPKPGEQQGTQQGSNRGEMAIRWNKQMTFDQNKMTIAFDGNPRVGFEQEPRTGKPAKPLVPMQVDSDQLIVTLSKTPPKTGETAGKQDKVQLSHMQANGNIHFVGEAIDLVCTTMDYDPKTSIMVLSGSEQQPGKAMNAAQTATGTFDRLEFNTETQELGKVDGMHGTIRR